MFWSYWTSCRQREQLCMKIHKLHCGNFMYKRCLCGYHKWCRQKLRVQTKLLNVMEQLINNKLHWLVYIWWFSNSQCSLWHHHAELQWLFYHFGLEESKTLWWLQDQRILHRQARCWLPGLEGGQPGGRHWEDLHCELQSSKMIHVLTKLPVSDIKTYKKIQITLLQTSDNHLIQCWCSQVDSLLEGTFYEFKVQAANMAGVGLPSVPSLPMKCVAWTMEEPGNRTLIVPATWRSPTGTVGYWVLVLMLPPVWYPGPAYDLSFSEVRSHSLVFLWKAPVYYGMSAVTGYYVDMAKKGSSEFETLNQEPVSHRYLQVRHRPPSSDDVCSLSLWRCSYDSLQVTGLEEGQSYVFRVRAVNSVGVGKPSEVSEPVCAKALPGNNWVYLLPTQQFYSGNANIPFIACV